MSSILVASPSFLEKNPPITKPEHLTNIPCLSFRFSSKNQWRLLKEKQDVRVKIHGPIIANSPEFIYHLALLGRGVGLIPQFLCENSLQTGALVQVLKGWTSESAPVHLLTPAQKDIPLKTKVFMDFASDRL
jgi:DNA-binding transcriptional LysR family regulator